MALKWVFGADTGPFRQGLASMRSDVKAFGGSIKGMLAGAFAVGTFSALLDEAGRIDDLAKRLDMSAESIQRIGFAAKLSGSDIELAAKGLTVLTRNLTQAERGSTAFDEAARALGIDLKRMRELSPEEQLVELSRGYTAAGDKAGALTAVIELMGKSGAELVPLLAEGPEVLMQKMEEAQVATDAQIATMAEMGDQIDKVKGVALKMAGAIITGFQMAGAAIEWALNKLTGFEGANEQFNNRMISIVDGDPAEKAAKANAEEMRETAEQIKKTAEERAKLEEKIAKLEEDAAMARLDTEGKIQALQQKRAQNVLDAAFLGGNEALTAREKQLEIEKEILSLQKQQQDENRAAAEKIASLSQSLADAARAEAEVDKENRRAAMTDEQKLADLKKEQAQLMRESRDAEKAGDHLTAIEKRTQAKSMNGGIVSLEREINTPKVPTIVANDMRRWGGSSRFAETFQQGKGMEVRQDKTNDLLRSIDRKLPERATTEGGGATPF